MYRPDLLSRLPRHAGIAVVRLRSLGDSLLVTPTLRMLKQWRPDLRLAFLVDPRFAPAVVRNRDIDEVIAVPGDLSGRAHALGQLRRFQPALTANLHGGSTASLLTRFSGASWRATFAGLRHHWAHNLRTPSVLPDGGRRSLHTVEHVASLFHHLGLPPARPGAIQLEADPDARERVRRALTARGMKGPFAFASVNPRSFTMRWAPEKWVETLAWMHQSYGLSVVMARPAAISEARLEESIVAALPRGAAALMTGTSVEDLIAMIAESCLMVGSDGGPVHIAAGLQKPVLAIFSSTDVDAWAPWQTRSRIVRNALSCSPCPADRCYAFDRPRCIQSVEVAQVRQALGELLA